MHPPSPHTPENVPAVVVDYVAEQLGLEPAEFTGYGAMEHRWAQQEQIRGMYGYTKSGFDQWFAPARRLYQRVSIGSGRPTLRFDLATKRPADRTVVLPGGDRAGTAFGESARGPPEWPSDMVLICGCESLWWAPCQPPN
ncbi:DUF4158 domain-containing protein [Streptomyces sp. NPDC059255]|uniref:DUF4158 domain-containing protein n=1 Tax=Streptomyces sp. NPDC059255 TaxID=3346793 RepID=UPI00367D9518